MNNKDTQQNNKRIAKNTIFLYFRMLLILFVGLYTSRVVLQTLGISDYGLYNVVGGVVTMFAFLNTTLTTSTQRFLNIELGSGNTERLKKVFSTALLLHTLLVVIVFLLAETVGLWFVENKLNVDAGRDNAVFWVYQFSIIAICVQIFQLPFMSTIIAHERMNVYAYVSIYEAIMKLFIVYVIQIVQYDKLILYGALFLFVQVSVALIYNYYCRKKFIEAKIKYQFDHSLFKEMLGFCGWNVIGCFASMCNGQGVNILFNLFFGSVANAARGIAFQVNGIVNQFANNFQIAIRPQVVKYYANQQLDEMAHLVFNSAKYSALLLLFLSVPIFVEIDYILHIWLGEYPSYAPSFIRIILFHSVVASMTSSVVMVVHASGRLKMVGITAGCVNLLLLPITYCLFKLGFSPETALLVNVCGSFCETFIELCWMKHYIDFPIKDFYKNVYAIVFPLGILMLVVPLCLHTFVTFPSELIRFFIVCPVSAVTSIIVLYHFGLDDNKKRILCGKIVNVTRKIKR